MIRIPLFNPPSPARRLIHACALALVLGGCAPQGARPGDIPDVPPLADSPAAEVPAETFTTIPTDPAAASVPAPAAAAPTNGPASEQDQRIAALELSLLNMSNELAWLKSRPANATTPWGTPSPKVVPAGPQNTPGTQDTPGKAPAPVAAPSSPVPAAQSDRIASLERNMQAIRDELRGLRGQAAAPASPWGRPAPSLAAVAGTTARPPRTAAVTPPPSAESVPPAPAPAPDPAQAATPPPAPSPAPPPAPAAPPPHPALAHIPQPAPDAVATPPLRRQNPQAPAAAYTYTIPVQTLPQTKPPQAPVQTAPAPVQAAPVQATPVQPPPVQAAPVQAAPVQTAAPARAGEQAAYQAALNAFESNNYNEAWNAFDHYLDTYPNGRFTPNALYWKGEVRYSLGDYGNAILLFKDVAGRFPRHQKAPDALLKIVMSYDRLRDRDNATLHLRILNEDYPQSAAARRAKSLRLS